MNLTWPIEPLEKGGLRVRPAAGADEFAALLTLRAAQFRGDVRARDNDAFDGAATHFVIESAGRIVGGFRLRVFHGAEIEHSYSAQYYDLARLCDFPDPMLELGRFCIDPAWGDGDSLRLAWGAITRQVDLGGVGLLFGCSSFAGCRVAKYSSAFALLRDRHGAPPEWAPSVRAPEVVRFDTLSPLVDRAAALRAMPPLLRTYLAMGGWVSDHAVVDRELNTLHVFTGLEIGRVPPGRARLLRALAAGRASPLD